MWGCGTLTKEMHIVKYSSYVFKHLCISKTNNGFHGQSQPSVVVFVTPYDVQRLMTYVRVRNRINHHLYANYELFESWRQLVEVMLHCLVHSDKKKELKITVIFELIQDLLLKVHIHTHSGDCPGLS